MQTKFNVEGMSCSHCENAVKKAILTISGVLDVWVDLNLKTVTINHDNDVDLEQIKNEIEDQGYHVRN